MRAGDWARRRYRPDSPYNRHHRHSRPANLIFENLGNLRAHRGDSVRF